MPAYNIALFGARCNTKPPPSLPLSSSHPQTAPETSNANAYGNQHTHQIISKKKSSKLSHPIYKQIHTHARKGRARGGQRAAVTEIYTHTPLAPPPQGRSRNAQTCAPRERKYNRGANMTRSRLFLARSACGRICGGGGERGRRVPLERRKKGSDLSSPGTSAERKRDDRLL